MDVYSLSNVPYNDKQLDVIEFELNGTNCPDSDAARMMKRLIITIRDRDKIIKKLNEKVIRGIQDYNVVAELLEDVEQQNNVLIRALEWIRDKEPKECYIQAVIDTHNMYKRMANKTLSKIKQTTKA